MTSTTPGRILVIDDNRAIHEDFRKVLCRDESGRSTVQQTAAKLFDRPAKAAGPAPMQLDFASQGQEGLGLVETALRTQQPYAMAFVDIRMPPGWDGIETITRLWQVQPDLQVVICTAYTDYSWEEIDRRLGRCDRFLILKKPFDTVEVRQMAVSLTSRARLETELKLLQKEMLEASRQAGKAEIATGVLHNVGNVLNSISVSATVVSDRLRQSKVTNLRRATSILCEQNGNLARFLTSDPKGKVLPEYLGRIAEQLATEQSEMLSEIALLNQNIDHIKKIVSLQQDYAKVSGASEEVPLAEVVEAALGMNAASLEARRVTVVREDDDSQPRVNMNRHLILQVLINLITNAKHAMDGNIPSDKRLLIQVKTASNGMATIHVRDNGAGITPENLGRIFEHGFTTKKSGHGFGLHSGANAAKEMGGSLTGHSDGPGKGAEFILELPTSAAARKESNPITPGTP